LSIAARAGFFSETLRSQKGGLFAGRLKIGVE
jgi:hypothetical protein